MSFVLHILLLFQSYSGDVMRDQQILEDVKQTLELLTTKAPGRAIEVRVPPYAAVQCGDGPTHTRGTPANVIEMDAHTWLALANGEILWADALHSGAIRASGVRADLSQYLPLRITA
ncbi:unannotated protein [freshwater metagenome]|uniref:Unannotated protein n=1 Tax=freshwater metagenome TaxID=449393 RepID=A0A6J7BBG8_9ZZZZ